MPSCRSPWPPCYDETQTSTCLRLATHSDSAVDDPPLLQLPGERARANLPIPLTTFIGPADDIAAITQQVLAEPPAGVRLLTLTGPGGCGKTRLALAVAAALAPAFPDSAHWIRSEERRV